MTTEPISPEDMRRDPVAITEVVRRCAASDHALLPGIGIGVATLFHDGENVRLVYGDRDLRAVLRALVALRADGSKCLAELIATITEQMKQETP